MLFDSLHISVFPANAREKSEVPILVYMIPGNPGLIEYYRDFLELLATGLRSKSSHIPYEIYGKSLAGFEVGSAEYENNDSLTSPPYSLQEQVMYVHKQVEAAVKDSKANLERHTGRQSSKKVPVILMGHSVGAYILLEIIARQQAMQKSKGADILELDYEILSGICLFPTVTHIADSPTGTKVGPITQIPGLASVLHLTANRLCAIISRSQLFNVVKWITKMPDGPAEVTTAFVESKHGVRQSLYMGKQELEEITEDRWDNDVWGSNVISNPFEENSEEIDRPKLYFFWGGEDHWVNNTARDRLIETRGRKSGQVEDTGKPHMKVDVQGIPHAFCIRHSEKVAQKVTKYIGESTTLLEERSQTNS